MGSLGWRWGCRKPSTGGICTSPNYGGRVEYPLQGLEGYSKPVLLYLNMHQNHLEGSLELRLLGLNPRGFHPVRLVQELRNFSSYPSQVMLMLLVRRAHFENHCTQQRQEGVDLWAILGNQ